ncbi:MAG: peptidoglycan DD-metalloendopeptidase family protein [bacterium]
MIIPVSSGIFLARGEVTDASNNPEVVELNRQIRLKREQADELQKKQKEYEALLAQKQDEKIDLNYQIAMLDNHVAKTQIEADSIKLNLDQTELQVRKTNLEIFDKQEAIDKEKEHISSVLRVLYKENQTSSLEILLLNDSFSDFLNQLKYLGDVNGELALSLGSLRDVKASLETKKAELNTKVAELAKLKIEYDDKLAKLQAEKENKSVILSQIMISEAEYETLIAQAKKEQSQASADAVSYEQKARQKLQASKEQLVSNPDGLTWPVPKNTITAYFHDPDYPFRYLFEHPAIDIRAPQGTKVHAAAAGYVARAKDAGMGYSYIMIVHADGLATVYGHVSKILVEEDSYVNQGDVIGLSGAMPGTPGAGKLTSGPHMHFEVRLNGIPVNPLDYLQ